MLALIKQYGASLSSTALTLLKIGLVIFLTELAIMYVLATLLPQANRGLETLLDATLVTFFSSLLCQRWLPALAVTHDANEAPSFRKFSKSNFLGWITLIGKFAIVLFSVEGAIMLLLPAPHLHSLFLADSLILAFIAPPLIYFSFAPQRHHAAASHDLSLEVILRPFLRLFIPVLLAAGALGSLALLAEIRSNETILTHEAQHHLEIIQTGLVRELQGILADLLLLADQYHVYDTAELSEQGQNEIVRQFSSLVGIKQYYNEIMLLDKNGALKIQITAEKLNAPSSPLREVPPMTLSRSGLAAMSSGLPILFPLGRNLEGHPIATPGKLPPLLLGTPVTNGHGDLRGFILVLFSPHDILARMDAIAQETGGRFLLLDHHGDIWHDSTSKSATTEDRDNFSHTFNLDHLPCPTPLRDLACKNTGHLSIPAMQLHLAIPRAHLFSSLAPFITTLFHLGLTMIPLLAMGSWSLTVSRLRHQEAERALANHADELERIVLERTRQLVHADRLATLGTFSAGMAHEINNPNAFIASNIDFLKLYWQLARPILSRHGNEDPSGRIGRFADELESVLSGILDGSQRITKIVSSLKTYSKGGMNADMVVCRLLESIQDAQNLLQFKLKNHTQIVLDVPADHVLICDRQQMAQVFVNLIQNAMEAMENNPIEIPRTINISSVKTGEHFWVRCRDSGPGIPKEAIEKIFDPFYTTKGKTKGTGLGLSIVHGIISDHFGQISAFNHAEGGAEFLVILPNKALFEKHFLSRMAKEHSHVAAH